MDRRDDNYGARAEWFNIKRPNRFCDLTKHLEICYVDYELYRRLESLRNKTEHEQMCRKFLEDFNLAIKLKKNPSLIRSVTSSKFIYDTQYWNLLWFEGPSHALFKEINESFLRIKKLILKLFPTRFIHSLSYKSGFLD